MCIMCMCLININIVYADQAPSVGEASTGESDLEEDYSREEYESFYREEPVGEREEIKIYYNVTFVDKINHTKKVIKVEKDKTVEEIEVKNEQIRLKGNKIKIFNYWADKSGKKYNFNKKIKNDITLYAKYYVESIYEKNFAKYSVKFDSQGGTFINSTSSNGLVKEPKKPYRQGYSFLGWYTKKDGGEKWNFKKDYAKNNLTLYAHWNMVGYKSGMISPKTGYNYELIYEILIISFCLILLSMYKLYTYKREME